MAPVGDTLGDELRVGNDHGDVLLGDHHGGAGPDTANLSADVAHLDAVAHLDRALEEDDQAAHEVAGHVLEAETEPHAHRARQNREGAEVDAYRLKDHHDTHCRDRVSHQRTHRLSHADVEMAARQEGVDHPPREAPAEVEQEDQSAARTSSFPTVSGVPGIPKVNSSRTWAPSGFKAVTPG